MKRYLIILISIIAFNIGNAQIEIPDEAKEELGGVKGKGKIKSDSPMEKSTDKSAFDKDFIMSNLWIVRSEYVLTYSEDGVKQILAKEDDDYFSYADSYAIAADGMIWLDNEQLKPWLMDKEWELYKDDTLKPELSNVSVRKLDGINFNDISKIESDVTILNENLSVFNLPSKNTSFKVDTDVNKDNAYMILIGHDKENYSNTPDLVYVKVEDVNDGNINKFIKSSNEDGSSYYQGIIINNDRSRRLITVSTYINSYANSLSVSDLKYKKALKVIKKEGKAKECCCDDIENASKKDYKKIIKKWESLLEKSTAKLENTKNEEERKSLLKQIEECEAKLENYKKGFLGIKF